MKKMKKEKNNQNKVEISENHFLKNTSNSVSYNDYSYSYQLTKDTINEPILTTLLRKSWLDDNDILFGEGLYNMNWQKVIQKIRNDPEGFVEEGCWNFLAENASDDESDSDEEDPDPEYTEEEEEESESDYDDEDESYDESESEGEDEGESALSEEGMSWDEMEEKAKKDDHERAKKIREEEKFKKKGKKFFNTFFQLLIHILNNRNSPNDKNYQSLR